LGPGVGGLSQPTSQTNKVTQAANPPSSQPTKQGITEPANDRPNRPTVSSIKPAAPQQSSRPSVEHLAPVTIHILQAGLTDEDYEGFLRAQEKPKSTYVHINTYMYNPNHLE